MEKYDFEHPCRKCEFMLKSGTQKQNIEIQRENSRITQALRKRFFIKIKEAVKQKTKTDQVFREINVQ